MEMVNYVGWLILVALIFLYARYANLKITELAEKVTAVSDELSKMKQENLDSQLMMNRVVESAVLRATGPLQQQLEANTKATNEIRDMVATIANRIMV